jgi:hypothetical protein
VLLRGSGGYRMVSAASAGRQGEGASYDGSASHRVQTFALVDSLRKTALRSRFGRRRGDDARSPQCS